MTLINCPKCKKGISDKATHCPHCDYHIENSKIQENIDSILKSEYEKSRERELGRKSERIKNNLKQIFLIIKKLTLKQILIIITIGIIILIFSFMIRPFNKVVGTKGYCPLCDRITLDTTSIIKINWYDKLTLPTYKKISKQCEGEAKIKCDKIYQGKLKRIAEASNKVKKYSLQEKLQSEQQQSIAIAIFVIALLSAPFIYLFIDSQLKKEKEGIQKIYIHHGGLGCGGCIIIIFLGIIVMILFLGMC